MVFIMCRSAVAPLPLPLPLRMNLRLRCGRLAYVVRADPLHSGGERPVRAPREGWRNINAADRASRTAHAHMRCESRDCGGGTARRARWGGAPPGSGNSRTQRAGHAWARSPPGSRGCPHKQGPILAQPRQVWKTRVEWPASWWKRERTRSGRGPHDRLQMNGRGPDAGTAGSPWGGHFRNTEGGGEEFRGWSHGTCQVWVPLVSSPTDRKKSVHLLRAGWGGIGTQIPSGIAGWAGSHGASHAFAGTECLRTLSLESGVKPGTSHSSACPNPHPTVLCAAPQRRTVRCCFKPSTLPRCPCPCGQKNAVPHSRKIFYCSNCPQNPQRAGQMHACTERVASPLWTELSGEIYRVAPSCADWRKAVWPWTVCCRAVIRTQGGRPASPAPGLSSGVRDVCSGGALSPAAQSPSPPRHPRSVQHRQPCVRKQDCAGLQGRGEGWRREWEGEAPPPPPARGDAVPRCRDSGMPACLCWASPFTFPLVPAFPRQKNGMLCRGWHARNARMPGISSACRRSSGGQGQTAANADRTRAARKIAQKRTRTGRGRGRFSHRRIVGSRCVAQRCRRASSRKAGLFVWKTPCSRGNKQRRRRLKTTRKTSRTWGPSCAAPDAARPPQLRPAPKVANVPAEGCHCRRRTLLKTQSGAEPLAHKETVGTGTFQLHFVPVRRLRGAASL
eukprot:gene8905-biopygen10691